MKEDAVLPLEDDDADQGGDAAVSAQPTASQPEGDGAPDFMSMAEAFPEQGGAPDFISIADAFKPDTGGTKGGGAFAGAKLPDIPDFIPMDQVTDQDISEHTDRGPLNNFLRNLTRELVLQGWATDVLKGAGRLLNPDNPKDNFLHQTGENLQRGIDYLMPQSQTEAESVAGGIGKGIGDVAPAVAAVLMGGPIALGLGAIQMATGGAETLGSLAESKDASPENRIAAERGGAAVGAVAGTALGAAGGMLLPALERTAPGFLNWASTILKNAAREGTVFAGVGEAQEYLNKRIEQAYVDPESEYHFDLKRLVTEFGTGAFFGGGKQIVSGGYRPGKERAATEPDTAEDMRVASSSEPPKNTIGNAPAQPRPIEQQTPNPGSGGTGSERLYEKRIRERMNAPPVDEGEGVLSAERPVDPAVQEALAPEPAPVVEPPASPPPAAPALQPNPTPEPPPFQQMPERPRMLPPVTEQHAADVAQAEGEGMRRAVGNNKGQEGELFAPEAARFDQPNPAVDRVPERPANARAEPAEKPSLEAPPVENRPQSVEKPVEIRPEPEKPVRQPRVLEDLSAPRVPEARESENAAQPAANERPIDRALALASKLDQANETTQKLMAVLNKAKGNPKLAEVVAKRFLAQYSAMEKEPARVTPEVRAPERAPIHEEVPAPVARKPVSDQPTEQPRTDKSIVDHNGRVVGRAPEVKLATRRSFALKLAHELMTKHEFPDTDITKPAQVKALREKAREVLRDAEEQGYPVKASRDAEAPSDLQIYLPREKVIGENGERKPHLEATPAALWLSEVKAFAQGKRSAADFVTRDLFLRAGDQESVDIVREDRFAAGDRQRRTPEVTNEGNLAPRASIDASGIPDRESVFTSIEGKRYRLEREKTVRDSSPLHKMLKPTGDYADIVKEVLSHSPNVMVHTIDPKAMDQIAKVSGFRALEAYYDPTEHAIFVRPGVHQNTVLHEAIHAATSQRLLNDPAMTARIEKLMEHLRPDFEHLHPYAMSNVREFLAHATSDGGFQGNLARYEMPAEVIKELGLGAKIRNGFQAFVDMVRQVLNLPEGSYNALEAAMQMTHEAMERRGPDLGQRRVFGKRAGSDTIDASIQSIRDQADGLLHQLKGASLLKLRDSFNIARAADHLFGGPDRNPIRTIVDSVERARVRSLELAREVDPLLKEGLDLKRADPTGFHDMETLMQDESMYQRFGDVDLKHQGFSTKGINEQWKNTQHPDLERRWNALSADIKDHRQKLYDYYEATHLSSAEETASARLLKELGLNDADLAKRTMDGTLTTADFRRLGPDDNTRQANLEIIQEAAAISKLAGPYTPFIRRGRYAVTGEFKTTGTDQATRETIPGRAWEFDDKQKALDFATQQHGRPHIDSYYVDGTSGERFTKVTEPVTRGGVEQKEPGTGRVLTQEREIPISKNDPNAVQRWQVRVEKGYLKMHDTRREALAHEAELSRSGIFDKTDAQPKKYQPYTDAVTLASNLTNLEAKLKHNSLYENMSPKQRETVKQLLAEHYLQMQAATRVHSSRLHRNFVKGADDDVLRNTMDYSHETANRRGRMEHQNAIDTARKKAEDMVNEGNTNSHARRAVLNEIDERLDAMKGGGFRLASGQMGPAQQRLMSWSYTARLATPGFTIRNLTQPWLYGSEIAGRHGFGSTGRELMRAYRDIGGRHVLAQGARDTGRAAVGKLTHPETVLEDIMQRPSISADDKFAIDYMVKNGRVDPDAGFQMGETIRSPEGVKLDFFGKRRDSKLTRGIEGGLNKLDTGLHWIEEVSRQMPRAAETINRVTSGLVAFRLEMKKNGGDREKAARYADDVVGHTQFVYSDTNKPTWQRNPFARAAFQFKQFGKSTYEFLGRHIATSVDRQATPEERSASRKALGGLFVAHTIVAGSLGLPWEPVRAMLIGAKQLGWTNKEWDDVENGIREAFVGFGNLLGLNEQNAKKLGEVLSRGLPRLAGIDLSPGLGLDNMMLFGSPRSGTDKEMDNNLSAWMFNMMAGAPTALQIQMLSGMRDLVHGEYAKGVEKLMPMKIAGDVIKAEEGYRNGKKDARGRETAPPYSAYQAGVKAMGLPVGEEAERNTYQHQVYQQGTEQRREKADLIATWLKAETPAAKDKASKAAFDGGVKPVELTQALQRQRAANRRAVDGVVTTKETRPIADRLGKVYNFNQE